jgi:protein-tyrosine-phosphatase
MAKRSERTVLFLCTGNYYRSGFAEALFIVRAGEAFIAVPDKPE